MNIFRIITVFALVTVFGLSVNAQNKNKTEADVAYSGGKYYKAIEMYKKAYTKESKNEVKAEILFQIAECYRGKSDGKQAAIWYNKAIKARYDNPIAIYNIANIYKSEGRYEDAIVEFNKYKAANPSDKRADEGIKSSKLAKKWKDEPTGIVVTPMLLINSEEYDFSPVFADNENMELYFTSTRQGSAGEGVSDVTGMNFSDIYRTKVDKKGKWSEPVVLEGGVNSPASEGSSCLNKKINTMYFTRCGVENKSVMGCSLFWVKKQGLEWGEPKIIPITEDTSTVGHPAISNDDKVLVFASNMSGGKGGKDLWYVSYNEKKKEWSKPTNLGATINTASDEMFPFIKEDGTLYFASTGHLGMGGLDIFKAKSSGTNQWSEVTNLQSPINSEANDFGIIFNGAKQEGFFTTDREGGKGGDDIWAFKLPPVLFQLDGVVKNVETGKAIVGAKVKLIGTDGSFASTTTDENGNFFFAENGSNRYLNKETSYSIIVEKQKYLSAKGKETNIGLTESRKFFHTYVLQPFQDVVIKLPSIEYQTAKWDLQPQYKDSLNFLYDVMTENPTLIIQLRSHTDYRGSNPLNQRLSQKRAQSCVDYLVKEKGIHAARIKAIGMGENEPIKDESGNELTQKYIDALKSKEEKDVALQRNRRTDFTVIGDDFVPPVKEN